MPYSKPLKKLLNKTIITRNTNNPVPQSGPSSHSTPSTDSTKLPTKYLFLPPQTPEILYKLRLYYYYSDDYQGVKQQSRASK